MSFREKSAWISFVSILIVAVFYFTHVPWSLRPAPNAGAFDLLIISVIALAYALLLAFAITFAGCVSSTTK